jgi:tungstate transport system permease protein
MHYLIQAFGRAFAIIVSLDPVLLRIIVLSLKVSGWALIISTVLGLPLGAFVALKRIKAKGLLISLMNTMMGLPPVVVGLFLYLVLSRSGPMGFLGLLYTPDAMIAAQTVLALPIVGALSHSAIVNVDAVISQTAKTLGATQFQTSVTVVKEARYGIMSALIAGFGRVMAEVGAILIVGGNIAGYTRVMTTTIALETDKGNFELALALGIVLLVISMAVNLVLYAVQRKGDRWRLY